MLYVLMIVVGVIILAVAGYLLYCQHREKQRKILTAYAHALVEEGKLMEAAEIYENKLGNLAMADSLERRIEIITTLEHMPITEDVTPDPSQGTVLSLEQASHLLARNPEFEAAGHPPTEFRLHHPIPNGAQHVLVERLRRIGEDRLYHSQKEQLQVEPEQGES